MDKSTRNTPLAAARAGRNRRRAVWAMRLAVPAASMLMLATMNPPAGAVPSFTDQTGQPCQTCHVGGFGPQLTPFGREFKLNGFTMRTKASIPLAAAVQGSFVHTNKDQNPAPTFFKPNDNFAMDQANIFLAGGIGDHVGGFAMVTYDGVGRQWSWDDLDLRLVNKTQLGGKDLTYGFTLNNEPALADAWNTSPDWSFPYTTSALAPTPGTSALIDGTFAANTLGLNAYAWYDHHLYLEAGAYTTPAAGTLTWLGVDPTSPGDMHGLAPYGRIAYQTDFAGGTGEIGAFALKAAINPGRDRSSGYADHYSDVGIDASWQKPVGAGNTVALNLIYIHEASNLQASCALGNIGDGSDVNCAKFKLNEIRGDLSYYWHGKVGATLGAFSTTGSSNANLYAPTNQPNSNGATVQLDYTPWGAGNSPMGPRTNLRVGVQYTAYGKFNGAVTNYDGNGAKASDNNTLRIFSWLAF